MVEGILISLWQTLANIVEICRWMEIAVSSFRVTAGRCGSTEAAFTRITSSVLSWIMKIVPIGNIPHPQSQMKYLSPTVLR